MINKERKCASATLYLGAGILDRFTKQTPIAGIARTKDVLVKSAITVFAVALTGCAQVALSPEASTPRPTVGNVNVARILIDEGMAKLQEGLYEDASRIFNAGLKFSPNNARLHFLNGLVYHLIYLRGNSNARELAATGYRLALGLEPAFFEAALQYGRLNYEAAQYADAIKFFQHAIDIDPKSGDAHLGLAMAAYYAHDLTIAQASIEKALSLMPVSSVVTQAEVMINAATGNKSAVQRAMQTFEKLQPDSESTSRLKQRVNQWAFWHAALPVKSVENGAPPVGSSTALPGPPAYPGQNTFTTVPGIRTTSEPALPRWFRCDESQSTNFSNPGASGVYSNGGSGGSNSADETVPLPALPITCKGAANPAMALFEVTILRTEDSASENRGINMLDGLAFVLSASRTVNRVLTSGIAGQPDTKVLTITENNTRSLANSSNASSINYSLNIANAADSRSEVLAQPTLLALDRQPSTFFSGRSITLGLAGLAGSQGTFTDKPIGVSLSVTPTFIDGETMLVSVRAARSFVEQVDANVSFGQSMQTSRNAITSNVILKFGQTLVLSGLAEQEIQHQVDGVPVLKDIPLLQYLFSQRGVQRFKRSVIVLITPRKPEDERSVALSEAARLNLANPEGGQYKNLLNQVLGEGGQSSPTIANAYREAFASKLYLQFRTGDMKSDDWSTPARIQKIIKDIGSLIYF